MKRLSAVAVAASAVALACMAGACSRPIKPARTSLTQPVFTAESAAAERRRESRCSDSFSLLFPGIGQMCRKKRADAALLMASGAIDLGLGITVSQTTEKGFEHPGAAIPLLAFQDAWVFSNTEPYIDRALARGALYAPQESLTDLVIAPFNTRVLQRPEVWAGTLLLLGVGIGAEIIFQGDDYDTGFAGEDPNLFGRDFDARVGYPLGIGVGAGLFSHVAVAEEALFRGVVQSGLARSQGEFRGWMWASLAFGLTHAFNAFALPEDQRVQYLTYAVPLITGLGGYMGYAYQRSDYSLSVPVAIHFWYDLLLSTTFFVLEPRDSPLRATITLRF